MPELERDAAEQAIDRTLLERWDPLGVHVTPGEHAEYRAYAHEVYNLLARGASDVQVARYLHRLEEGELGHPELVTRDLRPVVEALREIERRM